MSNTVFVIAAFGITWTVIGAYLMHLRRVHRRARGLLERNR